jgi:hypothetical protein
MTYRYIIRVLFSGSDKFTQIAKEKDADTAGYWAGEYLSKENIHSIKIDKVYE